MWKENPDSYRKPVSVAHAKGVGVSKGWREDVRRAIPTRGYDGVQEVAASPRGDQVPRQRPSWGTQIQSTSQAPANREASLPAALCGVGRSEEHTSELQSLAYLVCRLLLEKKNKCTSR